MQGSGLNFLGRFLLSTLPLENHEAPIRNSEMKSSLDQPTKSLDRRGLCPPLNTRISNEAFLLSTNEFWLKEVARHLQRKIWGEGGTLLWSAQEEVLWIKHDHSYSLTPLVQAIDDQGGVSCPTRPSYSTSREQRNAAKRCATLKEELVAGDLPILAVPFTTAMLSLGKKQMDNI